MAEAMDAMASHQPGSRTYRVMTAAVYFAGRRPSEVVMLRPRSLCLPEDGWGRIDVVEADIFFDEPGEPKTGARSVPIPPVLVGVLRRWIDDHELGGGDCSFGPGPAGCSSVPNGRAPGNARSARSARTLCASTTAVTRRRRPG
jgi:integrase